MAAPRLRDLALGPHLRRRTVRFRLTALYCGVFFPSGVALCLHHLRRDRPGPAPTTPSHWSTASTHKRVDHRWLAAHRSRNTACSVARSDIVRWSRILSSSGEFFIGSCIVLVAMIGVSVLLGWLVAGRVLRPLRVMTTTTRQISERNLHERLALAGPDDELKDLGDTIDGLLARLEAAFDSQRRFVANASHELRTPLMLSQTLSR